MDAATHKQEGAIQCRACQRSALHCWSTRAGDATEAPGTHHEGAFPWCGAVTLCRSRSAHSPQPTAHNPQLAPPASREGGRDAPGCRSCRTAPALSTPAVLRPGHGISARSYYRRHSYDGIRTPASSRRAAALLQQQLSTLPGHSCFH